MGRPKDVDEAVFLGVAQDLSAPVKREPTDEAASASSGGAEVKKDLKIKLQGKKCENQS